MLHPDEMNSKCEKYCAYLVLCVLAVLFVVLLIIIAGFVVNILSAISMTGGVCYGIVGFVL